MIFLYMLDAQYQFVMKLCLNNLSENSIQKQYYHDGGQLRPQSLTHTQAHFYIEKVTFKKRSLKHDCHVMWHFPPEKALFSKTETSYPCFSMFINHSCTPPSDIFNFVFQKLFVHDFNKED